ncbi:MBL fold metallo-hydrolase [Patescibacteria group bacterium]|nr:MBL fold metallo-hydrolase [Patescibacteria group bacterium]
MKNKILNGLKISFYGGAKEVTGSNYLVESPENKILIDCGLFQGSKIGEDRNYQPFSYDPKSIDALIVTHAHLDHVGRIPKLVREGFRGKIFSTAPTRELAELMMDDSLGVLGKESRRNGKKLIYEKKDIKETMSKWESAEYLKNFQIGGFNIRLIDAGHILGSAMAEITYKNPSNSSGQEKIVFTGDLGNPLTPLLPDPQPVKDADYLIIESTYGDRAHENREDSGLKLERIIEETISKNGVLMIPAFSLERTQKLLYEINNLVENGRIPRVPIFLDSPLSIKATAVYKKYQNYFNDEAKEIILSGDDLFNFQGLKSCLTTEDSKAINDVEPPKIIIAGSGMSNGGRIVHHEHRYLSNKNNTLLLVSFQAAGSLGRRLQDKEKLVKILGDTIRVNARIEEIQGFSCHPDMDELFDFVRQTADTVKKVFVAQGEPRASSFFSQRVRDNLGIEAIVPELGETYELGV